MEVEPLVKRWWKFFCLGGTGLVIVLYLFHFSLIYYYSVDIPFWDEWDMFPPHPEAGTTASFEWLFRPHNNHWIVPTRAEILLFYRLNGWNLASQQLFNFFIYGILLLSVGWGLAGATRTTSQHFRKASGTLLVSAPFLIFLLSPISYENHDWAFQSQFHFALLFPWWGAFLLFAGVDGVGKRVAGALMLLLGIMSQGIGATASLAVITIFVISRVFGWKAYAYTRRRALLPVLPVVVMVIGTIFLWRRSVTAVIPDVQVVWPAEVEFWAFLLNLILFGWGIRALSWEWGLFLFLISSAPFLFLIVTRPFSKQTWLLLSWYGMILGGLVAISLGRADRGLSWTRVPRYAEIATFLIPLVLMTWGQVIRDGMGRRILLMGGWLVVAGLFINNWNFWIYEERHSRRMEGVQCLVSQLHHGQESVFCPDLFPRPLGPRLDHARALELSFVERWLTGDSASSGSIVAD